MSAFLIRNEFFIEIEVGDSSSITYVSFASLVPTFLLFFFLIDPLAAVFVLLCNGDPLLKFDLEASKVEISIFLLENFEREGFLLFL